MAATFARRVWATALLVGLIALGQVPPAHAAGGWPLSGAVVRGFDPPEVAWGSGHRGIDVAGQPGDVIVAPRDGVVTYAQTLAGRAVLVLDHGDTRTTLEPVTATVPVGQRVKQGDPLGVLDAGHQPCPAPACLHWGLKRGDTYLDPLPGTQEAPLLLPDSAAEAVGRRVRERAEAAQALPALTPDALLAGQGALGRPADARLGSRFGPRFHPIFHEWRLHAGIDLSNACGTPLSAAADGRVSHMGFDSSGGWRLILDHGRVNGVNLQTVYLHAQGYRVRVGDQVTRGQQVGAMGSTGWSTGCHLHFSVKANGRQVDPLPWLG